MKASINDPAWTEPIDLTVARLSQRIVDLENEKKRLGNQMFILIRWRKKLKPYGKIT
jgi:hypothetical protein